MTPFVDANVIVKAFTNNSDKERCRRVLLQGEFVTDTFCLVEAEHAIAVITSNKAYAADCMKSMFRSRGTLVALDKELLFQSFRVVQRMKLNSFDAVHYATALLNQCSAFLSYDEHFDGLPLKRVEP